MLAVVLLAVLLVVMVVAVGGASGGGAGGDGSGGRQCQLRCCWWWSSAELNNVECPPLCRGSATGVNVRSTTRFISSLYFNKNLFESHRDGGYHL